MSSGLKLTKREQAVMSLFADPYWDYVSEGLVWEERPLIRNVRLVTNSLKRKGLIEFGAYEDENQGCLLELTDAGSSWVAAASGGGEQSGG